MHLEDEDSFPLLSVRPSLVNIVTLGHKGLYSDLSYFWLLQSLIRKDEHDVLPPLEQLYDKIKLVMRHHPDIESLYTLSCFVMTLDYNQPKRCEEIAIEGMRALPKSWMIPSVVGYMFAFVLKDSAKASFYYEKTAKISNSPPYLAKLSKRLLNSAFDKKDAEETLNAIINGTKDEDYKEFLSRFLNSRKRN